MSPAKRFDKCSTDTALSNLIKILEIERQCIPYSEKNELLRTALMGVKNVEKLLKETSDFPGFGQTFETRITQMKEPLQLWKLSALYVFFVMISNQLNIAYKSLQDPPRRISLGNILAFTIKKILDTKQLLVTLTAENPHRLVRCVYGNWFYLYMWELLPLLQLSYSSACLSIPSVTAESVGRDKVRLELLERINKLQKGGEKLSKAKSQHGYNSMSVTEATTIIRRYELGCMAINHGNAIVRWKGEYHNESETQKSDSGPPSTSTDSTDTKAAEVIASFWRKYKSRNSVRAREEKEECLLGLRPDTETSGQRKPYLSCTMDNGIPYSNAEAIYSMAVMEELEKIRKEEGPEILTKLLEQRRLWVFEYKQTQGTFPPGVEQFYEDSKPTEECTTTTGAANPSTDTSAQTKKDVPSTQNKVNASAKKTSTGLKKTSKTSFAPDTKGTTAQQTTDETSSSQVNTTGILLDLILKHFTANFTFENTDQMQNAQVYSEAFTEIQKKVDEKMTDELLNIKVGFGEVKCYGKTKQKAGVKKGKGTRKKKEPRCCLLGEHPASNDPISNATIKSFDELFSCRALTTKTKKTLDSLYHFVLPREQTMTNTTEPQGVEKTLLKQSRSASTSNTAGAGLLTTSSNMDAYSVRQFTLDSVFLPFSLSATQVNDSLAANLVTSYPKCFLLYGPRGCGKRHLIKAFSCEVGAIFVDLGRALKHVIANKPTDKDAAIQTIHDVFLFASVNSPAIVFMDKVEELYPSAKALKEKSKPSSNENNTVENVDTLNVVKLRKCILTHIDRTIRKTPPEKPIMFVGTTNQPTAGMVNAKQLIAGFGLHAFIALPDYAERRIAWRKLLLDAGAPETALQLNLSVLARVSEGYSIGSLKQCVRRVLTKQRIANLRSRPLCKVEEFLTPLSRTQYCWLADYVQLHQLREQIESAVSTRGTGGKQSVTKGVETKKVSSSSK